MADSWWRGGVIYQIYPRSYQDSSGSGCGDLIGITSRLEYVASLGVDAVWLAPFMRSPMRDFGYDVANYRQIDPMFGTMADFDRLLVRAHELGLKVMIDLVISHTSAEHQWFVESSQSRANSKDAWYVWADAKPDGGAPNNWLSVFGGSAWQWEARRSQYYFHNFLSSQPDLNFHNPAVQAEVLDIAAFWLARGVDGFRLDTINFYFHDASLRDNPALALAQRNSIIAPRANPYNYQEHIYDRNRPENVAFLEKFRVLVDRYSDRALIGEVGDAQRGLEIAAEYTKGANRIHMCYSFDFFVSQKLTAARVRAVIDQAITAAPASWFCWALSNHDVARHYTRLCDASLDQDQQAQMLASLLLSLAGSVCLYQGEELGLAEAELPFEALQDPYGTVFWPEYKGRDGCRTPMVWCRGAKNAGFSDAERTWLPIANEHLAKAVDQLEQQPASLLHIYRALIGQRRSYPALRDGTLAFVPSDDDELLAFWRCTDDSRVLCLFNFSARELEFRLPDTGLKSLGWVDLGASLVGEVASLPGLSALWLA